MIDEPPHDRDLRIRRIMARLKKSIPAPPPPPPPTPQKSWKGLQVGRLVKAVCDLRGTEFEFGQMFEVAAADSQGLDLKPQLDGPVLRWEDPDWKAYFETVRRPPKRKKREGN